MMSPPDTDLCIISHARFRRDDAIGMLADHVVHTRCRPNPSRFTDEEVEDDEE